MFGSNCHQYIWRRLGERCSGCQQPSVKYRAVMVWSCIPASGVGDLGKIDGRSSDLNPTYNITWRASDWLQVHFSAWQQFKKMPMQLFLMSETRKIKKQGEVQDICTVFYIGLNYIVFICKKPYVSHQKNHIKASSIDVECLTVIRAYSCHDSIHWLAKC